MELHIDKWYEWTAIIAFFWTVWGLGFLFGSWWSYVSTKNAEQDAIVDKELRRQQSEGCKWASDSTA